MLGFEKVESREANMIKKTYGKATNEYTEVAYNFLDSGLEVAKLSGFSGTDAIRVYQSLTSVANNTFRGEGLKISKRGENIYLLNLNINPVADAPEKR